MWVFSEPSSLARPKSETLALKSSSINMLLDLISRCTTLGSIASCKYARLHQDHEDQLYMCLMLICLDRIVNHVEIYI